MFHPTSLRWVRGPAWVEGADVVLDWTRGIVYAPLTEPRIGLDLTKVKSEADVVAFAQQYGLLTHRASTADGLGLVMSAREWKAPPVPIRESVESILATADHLRGLGRLAVDIRKSADGDADALQRLRETTTAQRDDRSLVLGAADLCAQALTQALSQTSPAVWDRAVMGESVPPGRFRIGVWATTLKQVCYLNLATALAEHEPIEICPECGAAFVIGDARQRYCTPKCADRARFKRFGLKGGRRAKTRKR